jgi:hypothetical protein
VRCIYCRRRAGIVRKVCPTCARVVTVFEQAAGRVGWTELVDQFANAGLGREQVDCVLDAEIGGHPTLRDQMTAEMANVLMRNLGMPGRQSAMDVKRIRRSGNGSGEGTWSGDGNITRDQKPAAAALDNRNIQHEDESTADVDSAGNSGKAFKR